MSRINLGRWFAGGVAAGLLIWLVEGASWTMYVAEMQEAMRAHGLSTEVTAGTWVLSVVASLIAGLTLVFFYAASRPRFGPGPRTAIIVAVALWAGGTLLSLLGYQMIGLYSGRLLLHWGLVGLVEMILAAMLGGWIYRET